MRIVTKESIDTLSELKRLVGAYGEILEEYGGFAIKIIDERKYPWPDVCQFLLRLDHGVPVE